MKFWVFGFSIVIFVLLGYFLYQYDRFSNNSLRVVFCDVGQGDAVFVRTPAGIDVLIDGGPDESVLECLEDNMPFWDREIDIVFATHGHADHVTGLVEVVERYNVRRFFTQDSFNATVASQVLLEKLEDHGIAIEYSYAGDIVRLDDEVKIETLWPQRSRLSSYEKGKDDPNAHSLVQVMSYKDFEVLLTGDVDSIVLERIYPLGLQAEIFKVPHQGSKTGLSRELFRKIKPHVSIISVGENSYGHPHSDVLQIIEEGDDRYFRTDESGDVMLLSDGFSFSLHVNE